MRGSKTGDEEDDGSEGEVREMEKWWRKEGKLVVLRGKEEKCGEFRQVMRRTKGVEWRCSPDKRRESKQGEGK